MKMIEGNFDASGLKVGIVVSRFNDFITKRLLEGAEDALLRHGADADAIHTAWVPGAVELSLAAKKMAASKNYDVVITLGAVIRGATSHYDYVCNMVASGVNSASLDTGVPIIFGVITVENIEQAIERAGTKAGNKGHEVAVGAIEMANVLKHL